MNFVKVLNVNELNHGECKVVEVDGNEVALFNVNGEFSQSAIHALTEEALWEKECLKEMLFPPIAWLAV